ncbi:aminoglycoside phosphotransferase [Capronia epimyces CBS 606.96]|uniref:Aminoglycoside phosphotransferase n=1 Tax=Capronia epimyces CBS 606.96 TaxID=1182542 RepID=W9XZL8_9EURO|nr:aminoglycoside phosphotransferase [Capronia epimyces CBS 606.96]EXJ82396.1 aminoglycoside phosphotransferase [Capronia epimyces CBS 606.96]
MAGPVRQPIDLASLERYIDSNVPQIKTPLELKQFGFGQSNPTYQITDATGKKYVLRKKPPGKLLSKTAHQVDREYRIINALGQTDVPVPKAYGLCEDDSVIGTAFYIMEFLDGRMITDPQFPDVTPQERTEMWRDAVRTLAKFHRVDFNKVGLGNFGRHGGFYDRQLKTFGTLQKAQAATEDVDTKIPVGQIPHFDEVVDFFKQKSTQPKDRATLIHGDYKIDNLVFHKTEPRVIGILDWEMATIGHPLSDFVNLTSPWAWAGQKTGSAVADKSNESFEPGRTPGLPTLDQVVQWYAQESGYDPRSELAWGTAFGGFRGGIIMQGIAARYARRQASGTTAKQYAAQMGPYGEWTYGLVKKLKESSEGKAKL